MIIDNDYDQATRHIAMATAAWRGVLNEQSPQPSQPQHSFQLLDVVVVVVVVSTWHAWHALPSVAFGDGAESDGGGGDEQNQDQGVMHPESSGVALHSNEL